ncbi:fimbrial protein [Aquitalea sp. ASV11]|uniref:fimbrial protein n=1 Tax=Aquitalea sp. ASV11 TaxID=2795103 RepID=UPI0018EA3DEE|nr:fimbrial protein [Aquitalea sp. ASV11]
MKYFYGFLLSFLISHTSFATCDPGSFQQNVFTTIPTYTFNRNSIPVGGIIGTELISPTFDLLSCNSSDTFRKFRFSPNLNTTTPINGRTVFIANGSKSIGFSLGMEIVNACTNQGTVWLKQFEQITCDDTVYFNKAYTYRARMHMILYKLSDNIPSTPINLLGTFSLWFGFDNSSNTIRDATYLYTSSATIITNNSCTLLSSTNTNVNLPLIYSTQLLQIGSTSAGVPFNISINCPGPTKLAITFTDNNNIGQTGSILTPTTTSTAKGIGIQMKYNNQVISFGNDSANPGTINQIILNNNLTGTQTFCLLYTSDAADEQ